MLFRSPGEVSGLAWTSSTSLTWSPLSGAVQYHVYRGLAPFSYTSFGTCRDASDPSLIDQTFPEAGAPPTGSLWFYLVSGENSTGEEGTLGFGIAAERSNFAPCP